MIGEVAPHALLHRAPTPNTSKPINSNAPTCLSIPPVAGGAVAARGPECESLRFPGANTNATDSRLAIRKRTAVAGGCTGTWSDLGDSQSGHDAVAGQAGRQTVVQFGAAYVSMGYGKCGSRRRDSDGSPAMPASPGISILKNAGVRGVIRLRVIWGDAGRISDTILCPGCLRSMT